MMTADSFSRRDAERGCAKEQDGQHPVSACHIPIVGVYRGVPVAEESGHSDWGVAAQGGADQHELSELAHIWHT